MKGEGPRWTLKPDPDGFGFLYGELVTGRGQVLRLDVMPPASEWRGQFKLEGCEPHISDWVVYLDGIEVARVSAREQIADAVMVRTAGNVFWLADGRSAER